MNCNVLLVTVTQVESLELHRRLELDTGRKPVSIKISNRIFFDFGNINKNRVLHTIVEMGSLSPGAALDGISTAIRYVTPQTVIMVGIAFGMKEDKQRIGTILVSERIVPYELQKLKQGRVQYRGGRIDASSALRNAVKSVLVHRDTLDVQIGPIFSGEKLIDDIDYRDSLSELDPEAIGGEMEGAGLAVASIGSKVDWILVKAICDWADGKKNNSGKAQDQKTAAVAASNFVLLFLRSLNLGLGEGPSTVKPEDFDWRFSGGFSTNDHLLSKIPKEFPANKTRFELCWELLSESDRQNFEELSRKVFDSFIKGRAKKHSSMLNDAQTAMMIAFEIINRHSKNGKSIEGKASSPMDLKKIRAKHRHFCGVYPNTVNCFIRDILRMNHRLGGVTIEVIGFREAEIVKSLDEILRFSRPASTKERALSNNGPEVHAAYILGRVCSDASKNRAKDILKRFLQKVERVPNDPEQSPQSSEISLMRRTSFISLALLGDKTSAEKYVERLLNSGLESSINAGFHLEYYGDQPFDFIADFCSKDDGLPAHRTVQYLKRSLEEHISNSSVQEYSLFRLESHTLASIILRRREEVQDPLYMDAVQTLFDVCQHLTDGDDLLLYIEMCIDIILNPDFTAEKRVGNYFSAKNAPRNGWLNRGVQFPETVGAHTAGTIWLCNLVPEDYSGEVNISKLKAMLEVHDLAEGITGDIVTTRKNQQHEESERRLLRRLSWMGGIMNPPRDFHNFYSLFHEFHTTKAPEGVLAREIDSIDLIIQGYSILETQADCKREEINDLIKKIEKMVTSPIGVSILRTAKQMNYFSRESFSESASSSLTEYYFGNQEI